MRYSVKKNGIDVVNGKNILSVEVFSADIVRVRRSAGKSRDRRSLSVIMKPETAGWYVEGSWLVTEKLRLKIESEGGKISFYSKEGKLLLEEKAGASMIRPVVVSGEKCVNASQGFSRAKNEALYGLGQYEEDFMNYRDCEVLMI